MMFVAKWENNTKETRSTYQSWCAMRHRCYTPSHISYKYYGARGIQVCDRWLQSYDAFVEDMGLRPEGTTIEREDGSKDYGPGNCSWSTVTAQNRNKRSNTKFEVEGQTKTLAELARNAGIGRETAAYRLRKGASIEDALRPEYQRAPAEHGTTARYTNGACRCPLCKKAYSDYAKDYHARKRALSAQRAI